MKKLGVITIGEAPREDIQPLFERYLGSLANVIQVGVLDGMTKEQAEISFQPVPNEYTMTSKFRNGDSIEMSRDKITPIVQQKIDDLEEQGCRQILLLCTGVFYGLQTKKAVFIEPEKIIVPTISSLVKDHKLGIIGPLEKQPKLLAEKWSDLAQAPVYVSASPYTYDKSVFQVATQELKDENVSLILLDCMGYTEEMKRVVLREAGDIPIILSNVLVIKIVSELMSE